MSGAGLRLLAASAMALAWVAPAIGHAAARDETPAVAASPFARDLGDFIARLRADPNAPPGTVVVVVDRGATVFERAYGVRDIRSGAAMTLDTPVYNASVTKAYTGVLAAVLDADGTLPLSTSLRDVWPDLELSPPLDARAITAERLLSHSAGIDANGLVFRSVYTGDVSADDIAPHLASFATPGTQGFEYSNFGPFVWSAMAETRTGSPWRDLLRERVLRPLGLAHSTARLEDFGADGVARCHPRVAGGWRSDPPKPTPVLNAAGGMYTSARDAAAFLKAMLTDGASANGAIPGEVLRRSWERASVQDRTLWEMHRDGYGLGWDLGSFNGHRFVSRAGGYPGCRAISLFLPDAGLGVVVMSNGDAGVNTYHAAIFAQAIDYWTQAPDAVARAEERIAETRSAMAGAVAEADAGDPRLASVRPIDPASWRSATGRYRHPRLGEFDLRVEGERLRLAGGSFGASLLQLEGDSFLLVPDADPAPETLRFRRDPANRVVGFLWDDDAYERLAN